MTSFLIDYDLVVDCYQQRHPDVVFSWCLYRGMNEWAEYISVSWIIMPSQLSRRLAS
jgi:hypothetical protein